MKIKLITAFAAATAAFALSANAAVVTIDSVTGNHGGQGHGAPIGELITMIDGSGMTSDGGTTTYSHSGGDGPPPASWPDGQGDPSGWDATNGAWQNEWNMTTLMDPGLSDNAKYGWASFDLTADNSAAANLDEIYIWHSLNATSTATQYNVYYATTPTVALPSTPSGGNAGGAGGTSGELGDYDFASGGWTQLGGTQAGVAHDLDVISLGGISAQYIALEIIGKGTSTNRLGFAEVAVTAIPEPTTTALLGLGGLALIFRRRK